MTTYLGVCHLCDEGITLEQGMVVECSEKTGWRFVTLHLDHLELWRLQAQDALDDFILDSQIDPLD